MGFLIQFTGCATFLNYAVLIFEEIGASNIDPNVSAIILAIAQILGGLASATTLADTLGRKLTLIISFVGSAIGLFVLSLWLYLKQHGYDDLTEYSLVPVASISFVMFIASAGVISLFAVCFVESLPTKVQQLYIYSNFGINFKHCATKKICRFLFCFSGPNNWIDDHHFICVCFWIHICQIVPNANGRNRFGWMHCHFHDRMHTGRIFHNVHIGREKWPAFGHTSIN